MPSNSNSLSPGKLKILWHLKDNGPIFIDDSDSPSLYQTLCQPTGLTISAVRGYCLQLDHAGLIVRSYFQRTGRQGPPNVRRIELLDPDIELPPRPAITPPEKRGPRRQYEVVQARHDTHQTTAKSFEDRLSSLNGPVPLVSFDMDSNGGLHVQQDDSGEVVSLFMALVARVTELQAERDILARQVDKLMEVVNRQEGESKALRSRLEHRPRQVSKLRDLIPDDQREALERLMRQPPQ